MPFDDPDPTDPNVLVGVELPGGLEETTEMAWVFAEEFARMGHSGEAIRALFRNPEYAGAHRAFRVLGAEAVGAIVDEVTAVWGTVRLVDLDAPDDDVPGLPRRLPILRPH